MSRRWTILLAASIALVGPVAVPAHAQGPRRQIGEKYALLVGVRQYNPNELRNLPYSEPDVVQLARVLKDTGYRRVVLLTQTEGAANSRLLPMSSNIRTALTGMLADRDAADSVVIAFAGHGVQFRGNGTNFFCPMDAKLSDASTLISLDEIYGQMERSKAGLKLLMVDACRNDPQSDNSRSRALVSLESVTRPQALRPPGGVAALFSCSPGEKAFENDKLKHGVFYHFVIEGLKGAADLDGDGQVGVEELAIFAKKRVPDYVKDEYGDDVRQMPVLKGEVGGLAALVKTGGPKAPGEPDLGGLQGEWTMEREELNGEPDTITTERQITISGDHFVMSRVRNKQNGVYVGRIRVDRPSRTFDFSGKGPLGKHVELRGIFELEGDSLRLCFVYDAGDKPERPTKLRSYQVPGVTMVSLLLKRSGEK